MNSSPLVASEAEKGVTIEHTTLSSEKLLTSFDSLTSPRNLGFSDYIPLLNIRRLTLSMTSLSEPAANAFVAFLDNPNNSLQALELAGHADALLSSSSTWGNRILESIARLDRLTHLSLEGESRSEQCVTLLVTAKSSFESVRITFRHWSRDNDKPINAWDVLQPSRSTIETLEGPFTAPHDDARRKSFSSSLFPNLRQLTIQHINIVNAAGYVDAFPALRSLSFDPSPRPGDSLDGESLDQDLERRQHTLVSPTVNHEACGPSKRSWPFLKTLKGSIRQIRTLDATVMHVSTIDELDLSAVGNHADQRQMKLLQSVLDTALKRGVRTLHLRAETPSRLARCLECVANATRGHPELVWEEFHLYYHHQPKATSETPGRGPTDLDAGDCIKKVKTIMDRLVPEQGRRLDPDFSYMLSRVRRRLTITVHIEDTARKPGRHCVVLTDVHEDNLSEYGPLHRGGLLHIQTHMKSFRSTILLPQYDTTRPETVEFDLSFPTAQGAVQMKDRQIVSQVANGQVQEQIVPLTMEELKLHNFDDGAATDVESE